MEMSITERQRLITRLAAKLKRNGIEVSGNRIKIGKHQPGIGVLGAIDGLVNHAGFKIV